MIGLLLSLALAQDTVDLDTPGAAAPIAPSGQRIAGFGGAPGVSLAEQLVVGGDGGTSITTLSAQYAKDGWTARVRAPFAAYRTADGRDAGLGNLLFEGFYTLEPAVGLEHAIGVGIGLNPGSTAWTWATRADEVWPGSGVDLLWEARSADPGDTVLLARAAVGVHSTPGYDPLPALWVRVQATGGVDQALSERVGFVGEATVAYWEVAPLELAAFLRADPVDGVRLRGGFVLPPFTWFGWEPTGRPGGAREATLAVQVQAAM